MTTVFIVDDDEDVRIALSRSLQKRGLTTEVFDSARAFLQSYSADKPGCLVLDYGMPEMDGLELQAYLGASNIDIPIIFISGHGGIPESVRATKAGAIDFLEKPFAQNVLLDRIADAFAADDIKRTSKQQQGAIDRKLGTLTGRETEILNHILQFPARISSKEIALDLRISPRTVDIHRARVLRKMDVTSIVQLFDMCTQYAVPNDPQTTI